MHFPTWKGISEKNRTRTGMVLAALNGVNLRRRETPHMIRSEEPGLLSSNYPTVIRITTWSIIAVGLMLLAHADSRLPKAREDDRSKLAAAIGQRPRYT